MTKMKLSRAQQVAVDWVASGQTWEIWNAERGHRLPTYATLHALVRMYVLAVRDGHFVVDAGARQPCCAAHAEYSRVHNPSWEERELTRELTREPRQEPIQSEGGNLDSCRGPSGELGFAGWDHRDV